MADLLTPELPVGPMAPEMGMPEMPAMAPAPDPYADKAKILRLVKDFKTMATVGRRVHEVNIEYNVRFLQGWQWDVYDPRTNRFRPANVGPGAPKPVSNHFASTLGAYISVLARIEPTLVFEPATEDPEDRATADVATRAMPVIEQECDIRMKRQEGARWGGVAGTWWLETGYDPDPIHGERVLPFDECLACGNQQAGPSDPQSPPAMCQQCGSTAMIPAMDETGAPVGETVPVGKMYCDVVSPLEMYFDPAITHWSSQRRCLRAKSYHEDEAKRRWKDIAEQIKPDGLSDPSAMLRAQLPTLGAYYDETTAARRTLTSVSPPVPNRVSEWWYWSLPTPEFPEGLLAIVVCQTHVVFAGPLPYFEQTKDGTKRPFLPFVEFPSDVVPGSAWRRTPASDMRLLQAERNRMQAIIALTAKRVSAPIWLIPEGSNVSNFTGIPGQLMRYNPMTVNGVAKPERIPGQNVPMSIFEYINMLDRSMEEVAATYDVTKGGKPMGVSAGIALQMLDEKSKSRFAPNFILWENAWAEWAWQAVQIYRQFATEARMLKVQGKDGRWEIIKFLGADFTGRIDVRPEAGSSQPRSTLVERAEMEQMVSLGILPPPASDPELQLKALELYGKTSWMQGLKSDTKNAIIEGETFAKLAEQAAMDPAVGQSIAAVLQQAQMLSQQLAQMGQPPVSYEQIIGVLKGGGIVVPRVRPAVDHHPTHSREHGNELKGETSQTWPEPVQQLFEMHKMEHDRLHQEDMMRQMAARQGIYPTSGFLSNPGGQSAPSPQSSGSSPQRMDGEQREMEEQAA